MIRGRRDEACSDLEALRTSDRLRAGLPAFRRLVARSESIIREVLGITDRWYVAFSGGKDSQVVLHLACQIRPGIPAVFIDQGAEFPDTLEFVELVGRTWPVKLIVVKPEKGLLDLLEEYGAYGLPAKAEYRKGDILRRLILEPSRRVAEQHGFQGVMMGLRKEESRTRLRNLARNGAVHLAKSDGMWRCNPLADWRGEDVWAYITSRGLPYNAVYDKTRFQPREWIRVTPWAGGTGRHDGRFQFLRYYYPDLWDEFARRFPGVKAFA